MKLEEVQQPKQLQAAINYEIGTAYPSITPILIKMFQVGDGQTITKVDMMRACTTGF